ncbi:MAG TPA: type II toxin-antitoxin system VapC family toxin [Burkholderiales bacterium]|jgi:tRNA(fMet)-specific endonuclease VapC|nr:type II toxin-antitoxin system VapC family toxin [Burkholderiales bacterium]
MFDTNTLSALVHQRTGFDRVAAQIDRLALSDRLISTVTLSELQTMIVKADDQQNKAVKVWAVLTQFRIIDFDEQAARHAGEIRASLESRGMQIGLLDTLMAAHARSLGATVVTGNLREFKRVPQLAVENWLVA